MAKRVFIVEDEEFAQGLLGEVFKLNGYEVSMASNAKDALALMNAGLPDLLILDLGLPDEDGLVVTRQLRARSDVPIIVITGRTDTDSRMAALSIGVDDFITKPFLPQELLLRAQNLLRRASGGGPSAPAVNTVHEFEGWRIDVDGRTVIDPDGADIRFTASEFDLLLAFLGARGRVLSRDFLLDAVSRGIDPPLDRTIDVLVSRVRRKLGDDPRKPRIIATIPGIGYRFNID